jgi:predicted RNA-binding Zn ribbon-like protein
MTDTAGPATGRLRLPGGLAPGGLCLVQDLVNTGLRLPEHGLADLLADADTASRWLAGALARWADATGQPVPAISLSAAGLAPLRRLREAVRALATRAGGDQVTHAAPLGEARLTLSLEPGGRLGYAPAQPGWRGVAGLVAAEILLAQQRGQWPRFKACPLAACGVAFYDESRNISRVWHDVRTCGNQANLHAYRARRRQATTGRD